jgi:hypothetical protein
LQNKILTKIFSKNQIFKTEDNVPASKLEEKNMGTNYFFLSLKSLKKGVGSGSGPISQRYGSADPDPHQ